MIIVFGGAFNPPTLAHLAIYHHVKEHLDIDKFIYLPVSSLYTKRSLASNHHRFQMLKLLTKAYPDIEVSKMEFDDPDYMGTYKSLLRFQEHYPDQEILFLIGADNLPKLHKWINAGSLLNDFRFIIVNRNQRDLLKEIENDPFLSQYKDQFIILPEFNAEISSTEFRSTLNLDYVTADVGEYITIHQLYRG
ncbi:MAG: nicotinate (nicotinamide) nucleotide adenylyltransferase [Candidatus Izemoplasmatales bacterium]|nr:nicotinate (nicotinamide) nucleotide adenylyltransferase [Candidatus Izemoplasmatales bacterium]